MNYTNTRRGFTQIVIKKNCHSRMSLSGIFHVLSSYVNKGKTLSIKNKYVEDPRLQPSGMTSLCNNGAFTPLVTPQGLCAGYRGGPHTISRTTTLRDDVVCGPRGFTLIELLVVVLIIGILAAVAVPQYQKAVMRSRMTQAFITGRAFINAQKAYFLANGEYATDFNKLDIEFVVPAKWQYSISQDGHLYMKYYDEEIAWDFYPSSKMAYCFVKKTTTQTNNWKKLCETLTQDTNPTSDNIIGGRFIYKMSFE